jgi:hypothetical protein
MYFLFLTCQRQTSYSVPREEDCFSLRQESRLVLICHCSDIEHSSQCAHAVLASIQVTNPVSQSAGASWSTTHREKISLVSMQAGKWLDTIFLCPHFSSFCSSSSSHNWCSTLVLQVMDLGWCGLVNTASKGKCFVLFCPWPSLLYRVHARIHLVKRP